MAAPSSMRGWRQRKRRIDDGVLVIVAGGPASPPQPRPSDDRSVWQERSSWRCDHVGAVLCRDACPVLKEAMTEDIRAVRVPCASWGGTDTVDVRAEDGHRPVNRPSVMRRFLRSFMPPSIRTGRSVHTGIAAQSMFQHRIRASTMRDAQGSDRCRRNGLHTETNQQATPESSGVRTPPARHPRGTVRRRARLRRCRARRRRNAIGDSDFRCVLEPHRRVACNARTSFLASAHVPGRVRPSLASHHSEGHQVQRPARLRNARSEPSNGGYRRTRRPGSRPHAMRARTFNLRDR